MRGMNRVTGAALLWLLGGVMAAFAVSVFVYALRLPLPLWPAMMGG